MVITLQLATFLRPIFCEPVCIYLERIALVKIICNSSGGSSELMLPHATQVLPILGLKTPNIEVKL